MQSLVAHCDTRRVAKEDVLAVPVPERTTTWGVIGHGDLIKTLETAITEAKYEISEELYSLSRDGGKMFGVFNLAPNETSAEKAYSIGFRNSTDKSMAVGITEGNKVFVCDNLSFSGDFIKFRKHTGLLDLDELMLISKEVVNNIQPRLEAYNRWHDNLKEIKLSRTDKDSLFIRSMERNIVPFGKSKRFYTLFFKKENNQNKAVYEDNLFGFHGAITQLWGDQSLIGSGPRHKELRKLVNEAKTELKEHGVLRNAA